MDYPTAAGLARTIRNGVALLAATSVAAIFMATGVFAQTLTEPNAPTKWSPPAAKKSTTTAQDTAHEKSCSAFGAGFVKVPGTDACVKIGGWLGVESSAGR